MAAFLRALPSAPLPRGFDCRDIWEKVQREAGEEEAGRGTGIVLDEERKKGQGWRAGKTRAGAGEEGGRVEGGLDEGGDFEDREGGDERGAGGIRAEEQGVEDEYVAIFEAQVTVS